jgi:hypothetical protein
MMIKVFILLTMEITVLLNGNLMQRMGKWLLVAMEKEIDWIS